jgi:hypothetical protein
VDFAHGGTAIRSTPADELSTALVAVLPHEFGHSFMGWITGIKSDPWDIEWDDGSAGERKIGIGRPTSHTAHRCGQIAPGFCQCLPIHCDLPAETVKAT